MKIVHAISIGICAYNEEKKIRSVLEDIIRQNQDSWELLEIFVYSDGSTDNTINEVRKVADSRIVLIDDKKRIGKTKRLKQMFKRFSGDILVMFDADIEFAGEHVITSLLQPFLENNEVMLVGGNSRPKPPRKFFERAVYTTFSVFDESRRLVRKGNNIFCCTGSILAIRKTLAQQIVLPDIVNEDAYLYLFCISRQYQFRYAQDAVVYYQLPGNLKDYMRQIMRSEPLSVSSELGRYFGVLAKDECSRPWKFYLASILRVFLDRPMEVVAIVAVNIICRPFMPFVIKNYRLEWFTAKSTHR